MSLLSVIVPVYNEGPAVIEAHRAISELLRGLPSAPAYEVIFVDDGSADDSFEHLKTVAQSDPTVRVIKLATNCGSHMAIRAGLEHCNGDVGCFIACDLQEPPELIPRMLDALRDPVQIVWAVRDSRKDTLGSKLFARAFYGLARLTVSKNVPPSGASMFMLGTKALRSVALFGERNLTLEGLFATMGFPQAHVHYERRARTSGKSKWTFGKRLKLFADFFVAFSYTPLRAISYFGLTVAALGFIYALVVIVNRLAFSSPIEGWSSLIVTVLVIGGVQMIMMGVIGEYLWRTLDESRGRPRYIIEATAGGRLNTNNAAAIAHGDARTTRN